MRARHEKTALIAGLVLPFDPAQPPDRRRRDQKHLAAVREGYRERAHVKFAERTEHNLGRFPDPETFRPRGLIVRQIKLRWGSMSPAGRLHLNRRLIEAPVDAIDYVITHELCHIAEPNHGAAFYELLDRVLPDWQHRKQRLERIMA